MDYTLYELKCKEVIETKSGVMLGRIDDVKFNADSGSIESFIVYGRPRFFGLLGREEDVIINFSDIDLIGKDTVLVLGSRLETAQKELKFLKNITK